MVCIVCGKKTRQDEAGHDCFDFLRGRVKTLEEKLQECEEARNQAKSSLFRLAKAGYEHLFGRGSSEKEEQELKASLEVLQGLASQDQRLSELERDERLLNAERNAYFFVLMSIKTSRSSDAAVLKMLAIQTLDEWRGDPAQDLPGQMILNEPLVLPLTLRVERETTYEP